MAPILAAVIPSLVEMAGKIFDRVIPDKAAAEKAKLEFYAVAQTQEFSLMLEQIKVNVEEAKSPNIFIAGGRPFIIWTCGVSYAYTYVILPFLQFLVFSFGTSEMVKQLSNLPVLNLEQMIPVLLGLLGLGGLRTWEKLKDAEGNR